MDVERPIRYVVQRLYGSSMSQRLVRNLVYDRHNRDSFTDLYEHEKMLADRVRVDAYKRGIAAQVKAGDVVLDLGTGTGILAMFASAQGAKRVYAVDHSPFIEVAKRIAAHNGFENIVFVQENSRSFEPPEPVDVVIHEQMGNELFSENMIENLLDLQRRALRPEGRIVPSQFELFIEPAMLRSDRRVPYLWEHRDLHGLDFSFLGQGELLRPYQRTRYHFKYLESFSVSALLAEPEPLLRFDLSQLRDSNELPRTVTVSRKAVQSGALDGYCVYFAAHFDADNHFTTSPMSTPTHWLNRFFRTANRDVAIGDTIEYEVNLPDLLRPRTWSVTTPSS